MELEELFRASNDSIYEVSKDKLIKNLVDTLSFDSELFRHRVIKKEVVQIANYEEQRYYVPLITFTKIRGVELFVFPRLLILNSLIAFIIGFVIQFIVDAKAYKGIHVINSILLP